MTLPEKTQWISEGDLERNPRRVLDAVRHGATALIESDGELEAALMDIVDYRVLRALARSRTDPLNVDGLDAGLSGELVEHTSDVQARYDLVLAYYLAEAISLGRAAELLKVTWVDLKDCFHRLDIPLRLGPATIDDVREEIQAARAISEATGQK
jgi:predicted HTH domain antitoxin